LTGDEAFQRRLAMSRPPPPQTPADGIHDNLLALAVPQSGEEAYLRRMALSQPPVAAPSIPTLIRQPSPPTLAYNPFAPPSVPPPPPPGPAPPLVDERARTAAAIAAKLGALASSSLTPSEQAEEKRYVEQSISFNSYIILIGYLTQT
jgi:splicing factor 45